MFDKFYVSCSLTSMKTVPSKEVEDTCGKKKNRDKDWLSGSVVLREKNKCVRRRQEVVVQRCVGVAH